MAVHEGPVIHTPVLGAACGLAAGMLGIAYLVSAGAPVQYLAINGAALAVGMIILLMIGRLPPDGRRWRGAGTLLMALVLLATALFGNQVEGATRWVTIGPLFVQPSLLLLPAMIVGYARSRNDLATVAMIVAAEALALQPDRAMAGMLAATLSMLMILRPDRRILPAVASALAAFAVTLIRADALPAVPYVDQILFTSFGIHALAGLAVVGGSVLLIIPALGAMRHDRGHVHVIFAVAWLAAIAAAALGNYPTPVVGYGGSAILGYLLSAALLPAPPRASRHAGVARRGGVAGDEARGRHHRLAVA